MIYLDNAATTFPKPDSVYDALDKANRKFAFNTGRGSYKVAREATKIIDEARIALLKLVNTEGMADVVFAPSITISLNQIINGIDFVAGDNVYVSPYEHNAVARPISLIKKLKNVNIIEMPVVENTLEIDLEKLKYMFTQQPPKCVLCIHISNVTGYILPVKDIFLMAKKYDSITVLDMAQSLGLVGVEMKNLNADFIAFAGHKSLYGPFGVGGFITSGKVKLREYIVGGTGSDSLNLNMPEGYPYKYESASPNIVAIAGLYAALNELDVENIYNHEKALTDYLVEQLTDIPEVTMYLPPKDKHIGIVSFNIKGYRAEDVGMILDEDYDIAVRTGYHCAPFIHKWLKDEEFVGTVRVGVGRFTKLEEIEKLVDIILSIVE